MVLPWVLWVGQPWGFQDGLLLALTISRGMRLVIVSYLQLAVKNLSNFIFLTLILAVFIKQNNIHTN